MFSNRNTSLISIPRPPDGRVLILKMKTMELSQNKTLVVDEQTHLCFPTLDHKEELFQLIQKNRTYLEQYLPWIPSIKKEWHAQQFLREARMMNKGKQRLTTLIIHQTKLAGAVSLVHIDPLNKRAEMGYWLQEDLQGQGIMTRSCARLIRYVFMGLHLNRVEMKMVASNTTSKKIPLRLNFKLEGTLKDYQVNKEGNFENVEIYGLLKKDWKNNFNMDIPIS